MPDRLHVAHYCARMATTHLVPVAEPVCRQGIDIGAYELFMQPGPRGSLVQCFIKRNRNTQSYHLYLGLTNSLTDNGKFLLAACKLKRATCTDYIISLRSDDMSRRSNAYLGRVRSNFIGTKFTVFEGNLMPQTRSSKMVKSRSSNLMKVSPRAPQGSYPVTHISYELNVLGSR
ncbi:hypothetical protein F2Q69_00032312 [Brassica cretica]|uniref:Tubby C-terminal domain-containing protein n=1 Tax=Brassica cretica TaxID=69181 RepID=A0A8S9SAW5_BRACR|nr:hypothetical protein F2Q69_00032312 [Brassica cretica]